MDKLSTRSRTISISTTAALSVRSYMHILYTVRSYGIIHPIRKGFIRRSPKNVHSRRITQYLPSRRRQHPSYSRSQLRQHRSTDPNTQSSPSRFIIRSKLRKEDGRITSIQASHESKQ